MKKEETTQSNKKVYQSPELKDLGKIGEVTNTTNTPLNGPDGGTAPNYNS